MTTTTSNPHDRALLLDAEIHARMKRNFRAEMAEKIDRLLDEEARLCFDAVVEWQRGACAAVIASLRCKLRALVLGEDIKETAWDSLSAGDCSDE